MKLIKSLVIPVIAGAMTVAAAESTNETPKGWFAAGSHPGEYQMKLDHSVTRSGKGSAVLKSVKKRPSGFGTLMQTISAENYLGKRIRLSGWVKSEGVQKAALWLRVDGPKGEVLSFDNMDNRGGISGTHDWTRYEIVLYVPESSSTLNYGALMVSGGIWVDDLKLEVVDDSVPLTAGNSGRAPLSKEPLNMEFEER